MHEDDMSLLSKKDQEELRHAKNADPYSREDVENLLVEFKAIEPMNDGQRADIEKVVAWIDYCMDLGSIGLEPSWDGLVGQIGLCRNRWKKWERYGTYEQPTFFVVRRVEDG